MFKTGVSCLPLSPFGEAGINWSYARQEAFRFSERRKKVLGSWCYKHLTPTG